MKPVARSIGERAAAAATQILLVLTIVFMFLPPLLILMLSFSGEDHLSFPPRRWGFRQYLALAHSDYWLGAIWTSIQIAIPVAILSTLIALGAGLAIHRSRLRGRHVLSFAGITPLIVPVSAYAVALYGMFAKLGLIAEFDGMVIAHTILAVPLSLILFDSAMASLKPELELVAMTLGASRRQAWSSITLRLLMPTFGASLVFAFLTSFDEAVLVNFLGGGVFVTLPKGIFDAVRFGVDPLVSAIATLLIIVTAALAAVTIAIQRRTKA
jgi:ABC-type spermidine/putrescine transport system permease subunit II